MTASCQCAGYRYYCLISSSANIYAQCPDTAFPCAFYAGTDQWHAKRIRLKFMLSLELLSKCFRTFINDNGKQFSTCKKACL